MPFGILGFIVAAVLTVLYNTAFVVYPTTQALVLRFGAIARAPITEPGLQFKLPFVEDVVFLDKQILDLDSPSQEVIASDQKRLVVDAFARYKIVDPLKFYQAAGTVRQANQRMASFLNSATRRVLGEATFSAIVNERRAQLMDKITDQVSREASALGIQIIDVKIRRADLPAANSQAVYQRMQTERAREAADFRARGEEEARRIRAEADKEVTVLLSEAGRDAEKLRGAGDAERNKILAESFGKDPEFFSFYRSLNAYEQSLKGDGTRFVISPSSSFFKHLGFPQGKK